MKFQQELLFYNIRNKQLQDFSKLLDVTEGLENRLFRITKTSTTLK
ncbi:MAG: hypothetical protein ACRCSG_06215 [Cellulosilyticaceae bacterium]